jgi:two-component system, chemotaxis family, chemotaxis protein CheY
MLGQRRVLVVDDDDGVRELLTLMLGGAGYEVRAARDGAEALGELGSWQADLILLDMMMPVMDGWTFRQEQLASEQLASIPVVVLSAVHDAQREAEKLGVAAVMAKPFDLNALLITVHRLATANS